MYNPLMHNTSYPKEDGAKVEELLDDAVQDFNEEKDRKIKSNSNFGEDIEINKDPDIKTLGDFLKHFELFSYINQLEMSIEQLRRNKISEADQEACFKIIDKEIQMLSFIHHPDKVKNRGGTDENIKVAQKIQTAINATRTVLKLLNAAFIEDINIHHKFEFYTELSIGSLCNEEEVKYRIYEVMFKIGLLSRIKQENIISKIRQFLVESKESIYNYIYDQKNGLEKSRKYRDLAMFHLKCCIEGYEKLCVELEDVKEEYKSEKMSDNMLNLIENMYVDSQKNLSVLKLLRETAKGSLKGRYEFFCTEEDMDPYFVLPIVYYTNAILMCDSISRNQSVLEGGLYGRRPNCMISTVVGSMRSFQAFMPNLNRFTFSPGTKTYPKNLNFKDLEKLENPYYLVCCNRSWSYEEEVWKIIFKRKGYIPRLTIEEIEEEFYKCMEENYNYMESKFKVEDYYEISKTNLYMLDLKKCMTLMAEFQKKQQDIEKGIREIQKKNDEMFEKMDKVIEETAELNKQIREKIEQRILLKEKFSNALQNNP